MKHDSTLKGSRSVGKPQDAPRASYGKTVSVNPSGLQDTRPASSDRRQSAR